MPSTADTINVTSRELYERATRLIPGGVSHPNRFVDGGPLYVTHAEGSRFRDVEGREYVDFAMGSAALLLGHAHPEVMEAIRTQAPHGTYTANCHPLEIDWAGLINELVPSAERVRFVASGTEASMLAVKVARAHRGRSKLVRFQGHYNGWHDYVLLGSEAPYDRVPGAGVLPAAAAATIVLPPDPARVDEVLRTDPDVAGIIAEVSGANYGSVPLPDGFLSALRALADEHDVVLIFDEVITGFRWGPGGLQREIGITPDLTSMAKIVAGGLPGGALAGKAEIMCMLDPGRTERPRVVHKGTFNGNPLAAAAGVATLNIVKTGEPHAHADRMAGKLREGMRDILTEHQISGAVYGDSSTFHVYFGRTQSRDSVDGIDPALIRGLPKPTVQAFQRGLRERGVNNMSYLGGVTSSAHTEEDIEVALKAFEGTVEHLMDQGLIGRS